MVGPSFSPTDVMEIGDVVRVSDLKPVDDLCVWVEGVGRSKFSFQRAIWQRLKRAGQWCWLGVDSMTSTGSGTTSVSQDSSTGLEMMVSFPHSSKRKVDVDGAEYGGKGGSGGHDRGEDACYDHPREKTGVHVDVMWRSNDCARGGGQVGKRDRGSWKDRRQKDATIERKRGDKPLYFPVQRQLLPGYQGIWKSRGLMGESGLAGRSGGCRRGGVDLRTTNVLLDTNVFLVFSDDV